MKTQYNRVDVRMSVQKENYFLRQKEDAANFSNFLFVMFTRPFSGSTKKKTDNKKTQHIVALGYFKM